MDGKISGVTVSIGARAAAKGPRPLASLPGAKRHQPECVPTHKLARFPPTCRGACAHTYEGVKAQVKAGISNPLGSTQGLTVS